MDHLNPPRLRNALAAALANMSSPSVTNAHGSTPASFRAAGNRRCGLYSVLVSDTSQNSMKRVRMSSTVNGYRSSPSILKNISPQCHRGPTLGRSVLQNRFSRTEYSTIQRCMVLGSASSPVSGRIAPSGATCWPSRPAAPG